ncbi:FAD-dependent monooxygenase [Planotetraspora sp. GP83]|uniref:FAD-dependent monooxygenase n=1 Tax=Planotetraspora sp. GP83 TaxID=3156264 RepID=UPI0035182238
MSDLDVDVLIVGGGAAGLTVSALLGSYGVDTLLVNAWPHTSILPKAHILNQHTMEILAAIGAADEVYERATPPEMTRYTGIFAGFAGPHEDYGRLITKTESWGAAGDDVDYVAASEHRLANLPQIRLEPIIRARAEALAGKDRVRFGHEMLSFTQDDEGVEAVILDRETGNEYRVRARYLLGCDGGRTVRPQLGIELDNLGPEKSQAARIVSIYMTADLSKWATEPEALLRSYYLPDLGRTIGLLAMGPDHWGPESEEWVVHQFFPAEEEATTDDEAAVVKMREALGIGDVEVTVHAITRWWFEGVLAREFRKGRAFLLGDAAHRHPPTGGLGLNSAVQDAYNIAWKLAAVLQGHAGDELLDTYEAERRAVTGRNVRRALENAANAPKLRAAMGVEYVPDPEGNWKTLRDYWADTPEGKRRRREVLAAVTEQSMEFRAHNTEYGYTYESTAVLPDGEPAPEPIDEIRVYRPSTRPGHPLPHAWLLDDDGDLVPIASLLGPGRFLLIAGEKGQAWQEAARKIAAEHGLPLDAVTIGHGEGDYLDPRCTWLRHRDIDADGAILVRPDRFVAWRSRGASADAVSELSGAVFSVLGRAPHA